MTMALSLAFTCFGFAQGLGSGQTASGNSQAQAAGTPSSTTPSQSDQNSAMNSSNQSGEKTLHGCIQSENGGYALQEKNGKMAMLSGSEDFSKHVGHEVKVHGTWSEASNSSASSSNGASSNPSSSASSNPSSSASSTTNPSGSATSGSNSGRTFNVDKLDMVSEQCSIK